MTSDPKSDPARDEALEHQLQERGLRCAARYVRELPASLERIWENVHDWEHLPWLHSHAFASIELLAQGAWGWRARLGARRSGDAERSSVLELLVERARGRYVTRTLEGVGAGSEFWTQLTSLAPERSRIELAFWVPECHPQRLQRVGGVLLDLYERLWDEDEAMILRRTAELRAVREACSPAGTWNLGPLDELRARLPLRVDTPAGPFRIVDCDGQLVAHSTRCPHRFGPLEDAPVEQGCVRCPWHGYRFDVRTGAALDGGPLRLATAALEIDPRSGDVRLRVGPEPAPPVLPSATCSREPARG